MATLFISDLHLRKEETKITSRFLNFLHSEEIRKADALYILGDLFEIWIGDDGYDLFHHETARSIKTLVNLGIPCYFIHGNRDFLIGKRFILDSGLIPLPEEQVINLYGRKVLIMHGDTLCTDDIKYRIFRTIIRVPHIQKLFLSLPLFIRNGIVSAIRFCSKKVTFHKGSISMTDVNLQAVINVMEKYRVQYLIYGHTHNPNTYMFTVNNHPAFRVVLGSWYRKKASIAKVTKNSIELLHLLS